MNIEEFDSLYESNIRDSELIFEHWEKEKRVDELLNVSIAPGVVLSDMLIGDSGLDHIKPELKEAFKELMKEKADTYEEIRSLIYEKIERGDSSVQGMVNKILGQVGENQFIKEASELGLEARLADSGSQKGYDVILPRSEEYTEYVQVKFHSDANRVFNEIHDVNQKLQLGEITDGDKVLKSISFAVPRGIHDEVVQKVNELNLNTKVYEINMTSEEGRDIVELGFGFSADAQIAFENLFSELLGSAVTATALHGLVNGFLLYKGAKDINEFYGDTLEQSAISVGAITAGLGTEALITEFAAIGGPALMVFVLGSTITARAVLKRIANRQSYIDWLKVQNSHLDNLMLKFNQ